MCQSPFKPSGVRTQKTCTESDRRGKERLQRQKEPEEQISLEDERADESSVTLDKLLRGSQLFTYIYTYELANTVTSTLYLQTPAELGLY